VFNYIAPSALTIDLKSSITDPDGIASTVKAGAFALSPNKGTIKCASGAGVACQVLTYTPAAGAFPTTGVTVTLALTDASGIVVTGQKFKIVALVNKAPKVTAGTAPKALVPSATKPTAYPAGDLLNALKASDPDGDKVYISAVTFPASVPKASITTLTAVMSGQSVVTSVTVSCSGAAGSWCTTLTKVLATVTVTDLKPGGTAAALATVEINPLPVLNAKYAPFTTPASAAAVNVAVIGGPTDVGQQGLIDLGFVLKTVSLQSDVIGETITALDILETNSTILVEQFTDRKGNLAPGFATVGTLVADLGPIAAATPLLVVTPTAPIFAASGAGRRKLSDDTNVAAVADSVVSAAATAEAAEPLPVEPEVPVALHDVNVAKGGSDDGGGGAGGGGGGGGGDDGGDDNGGNGTVAKIYLVLEPGTTAIGFWSSIGCDQTGELEVEFNAENDEDFDGKDDDGDGRDEDGTHDWNDDRRRRHRMLLAKTAVASVTRRSDTSRRLLRRGDDDGDGFGDDIGDNDDINTNSTCFGVDFATLTPEEQALCNSYVRSLTQTFTVPVDCTAGPIGGWYQGYVYGTTGFLRQVEIKVKVSPADGAAYIGGIVVSNTQIGV